MCCYFSQCCCSFLFFLFPFCCFFYFSSYFEDSPPPLSPSLSFALCLSPSISLSPSMATWDLSVTVEDLGPDSAPVSIGVASDLHVGGVILKLVEKTRRFDCDCIFIISI